MRLLCSAHLPEESHNKRKEASFQDDHPEKVYCNSQAHSQQFNTIQKCSNESLSIALSTVALRVSLCLLTG